MIVCHGELTIFGYERDEKLLKKNPRLKLITEFSSVGVRASRMEPEKYLEDLSSEFQVFDIDDEKNDLILMGPEDFSRLCNEPPKLHNLLCKR